MEDVKKQRLIAHFGQEWFDVLEPALNHSYYSELGDKLNKMRKEGQILYPAGKDTYKAFRATPFSQVRIVWLGMDPYSSEMANGLSFDCTNSRDISPSWSKMLEVYEDAHPGYFGKLLGGDLYEWAEQGVFMLNAALTVPRGRSGAHLNLWKPFTRTVIKRLVERNYMPLFVLIGADAKKFCYGFDIPEDYKIEVEHPAYAARQNRKWNAPTIFEDINLHLNRYKGIPIDWEK